LQVLLPKHAELVGKMVTVKIISSSKHSMNGEPFQKEPPWSSFSPTSSLSQAEVSGAAHTASHRLIPYTLFVLMLAFLTRLLWLIL
jgi:hypothetical protein